MNTNFHLFSNKTKSHNIPSYLIISFKICDTREEFAR